MKYNCDFQKQCWHIETCNGECHDKEKPKCFLSFDWYSKRNKEIKTPLVKEVKPAGRKDSKNLLLF